MKDPHDPQNYIKQEEPAAPPAKKNKRSLSGAYWYSDKPPEKLAEASTVRTLLTAIAAMLQLVVLVLPQGGSEYIVKTYPSYSFAYMWFVFAYAGVAVWVIIMNAVRYKIAKRIPAEHAPKNGFARRAYFGAELFIGANAVLAAIEFSFVCIHFDVVGLIAFFLCALATGAAVWARQVNHLALKDAVFIPAPDADGDENGQTPGAEGANEGAPEPPAEKPKDGD